MYKTSNSEISLCFRDLHLKYGSSEDCEELLHINIKTIKTKTFFIF